MDLEEVELWSDPISIWELLQDRRSIYLRALAAEGVVEAQRHTIVRQALEIKMVERKLQRLGLLYAEDRLESLKGRRLDKP